VGVLDEHLESAQQGASAQATGQVAPPNQATETPRAAALMQLQKDIAQFKKLDAFWWIMPGRARSRGERGGEVCAFPSRAAWWLECHPRSAARCSCSSAR
jgi:hypothetical protein